MFDYKIINKKHYYKNSKSIDIKILSDLHYCSSFPDKKLDIIEKKLDESKTDYIIIAGDFIDSTGFLTNDIEKRKNLIKWLTKICNKYKVILTLGGHDYSFKDKKGWKEDVNKDFFKELSLIKGLTLSFKKLKYEDENVIIYQIDLPFKYYNNDKRIEDKELLLDFLNKRQEEIKKLNKEKIKILVCHSPIYLADLDVLEYLKDFDFFVSGHMHNGVVFPIFDKLFDILIGKNVGIISPNRHLFPKNARGVKSIFVDNKRIDLIISGGLVKIQECTGHLQPLNHFFPMQMDEIIISDENVNKK